MILLHTAISLNKSSCYGITEFVEHGMFLYETVQYRQDAVNRIIKEQNFVLLSILFSFFLTWDTDQTTLHVKLFIPQKTLLDSIEAGPTNIQCNCLSNGFNPGVIL